MDVGTLARASIFRHAWGMSVLHWAELTWPQIVAHAKDCTWPLLPVGAIEAHGPHLPVGTDVWIAQAMAQRGAQRLLTHGLTPIVLPSLSYTVAPFAESFAGTVSLGEDTLVQTVVGIGRALQACGLPRLVLTNAHLDPSHVFALKRATQALNELGVHALFPDVTRKPYALWLGSEFRSGACHAGEYEGSLMLAIAPHLVDQALAQQLADNPQSLSQAIGVGKRTFVEAGGEQAYFGRPAAARATLGEALLDRLASVVEHAVTGNLPDGVLDEASATVKPGPIGH